jgi:hypothetical protein
MSQKIIVTTSPWKDYKTGKWMLSAVMNFQLDAAGSTTLASFPDILQWMDKLKQAIFYVQWNGGPAKEIKPRTNKWNDALYTKLFHNKIKVEGFEQPDISKLVLKSYPVTHISNFILDSYKEVGNLKTDELPKAGFFVNEYKKFEAISQTQLKETKPLTNRRNVVTENDFIKRGHAGKVTARQEVKQKKVISFSSQPNANLDFGQFHNYHARAVKNLSAGPAKIKQPEFEYHDIVSVITSYPVIMRKLGLILDFELPSAPPAAKGTVRVFPTNLNFAKEVLINCPNTAYEFTGNGFYAAAKPGSYIDKGVLKINSNDFSIVQFDTDSAAVKLVTHADKIYLQVAKVLAQKSNFIPFVMIGDEKRTAEPQPPPPREEKDDEDHEEGLPTLRSAGIGLVKNGLAATLLERFKVNMQLHKSFTNPAFSLKNEALLNKTATQINVKDANAYKNLMSANTKTINTVITNPVNIPVAAETLYADDIVLGYRMDIAYEDAKDEWYSLHQRKNNYEFVPVGGAVEKIALTPDEEIDEGCIHLALTKDQNDEDPDDDKVSEVMARWQGWSLSVPKPGKSMNDGIEEFKIPTDEEEKRKYKLNDEVPFRLQVTTGLAPKSLPALRFGKAYRIKVRTVDIAGNGLPHTINPENTTAAIRAGIKYLRYEPLPVPVLIQADEVVSGDKTKMRDRDGESLEHMVIRSNVGISAVDYEKNNPTSIYKTSDINEKTPVTTLTYLPEAVRHLTAPRNSQHMAELHGMFDESMKDINAAKEAYDFIVSRDKETKADDQAVKAAVVSPDAGNIPIEYLADPMAAGLVLTMKTDTTFETNWKKGQSRKFSFYFDDEVTETTANTEFSKTAWRNPKSLRVRLVEGSGTISWDKTARVLKIELPKSAQIEIKYASFWRPQDIDAYSAIQPIIGLGTNKQRSQELARKSLHWMFSPWRMIRLVHAVQQPLEKPVMDKPIDPVIRRTDNNKITNEADGGATFSIRNYEDTFAKISTGIKVNGSSTGKIDVAASWTEWVDDLNEMEPKQITSKTHVDIIPVKYTDKKIECRNTGGALSVTPDMKPGLYHPFNDTKHRMVNYTPVAVTRYREYFTGILDTAIRNGKSLSQVQTGDAVQLNILSSAKPAVPVIDYILPSFNWLTNDKGTEITRMRTGNIRVYLKRPWYSSGDGEKLAVVLPIKNVMLSETAKHHCTVWGKDPVYNSPELNNTNYPQVDHFPFAADYDTVMLPEDENSKMGIAAYNILFDKEKQMYYADIPVNIGAAYFPFVRLCLARYQRNSLRLQGKDCCLSNTVTADWLQVVPVRYTGLYFKGSKNIFDVAVRGTAPYSVSANNIIGLPNNYTRCRIKITIENTQLPKTDDVFLSINDRAQGLTTTVFIKQYDLKREQLRGNQIEFVERIELDGQFATQPFRVVIREYELHEFDPIRVKEDAQKRALNRNQSFSNLQEYHERLVFMDVYEVNGPV